MRNLPTLAAIAGDPGVLKGLSLDALDALLGEADAEAKIAAAVKKAVNGHIEATYAGDIAHAYSGAGKDFGTVHIVSDGFDIEVTTPKKPEWDQAMLGALRAEIAAAGDDPDELIKVEYAVEEKKYTAWPAFLQRKFEPARTLKPGTRTLKLSRAKAEAA